MPDAPKEVSPGLSETLKIIEIGNTVLNTEDSSVNDTQLWPHGALKVGEMRVH